MEKTQWVRGILIVMLLIAMPVALAFGQAGKKLSLDECIEIALKNNSQLKNAERDIELARTDIITARSALLPNIDASFMSGRYIQGPRLRKYDVPVGIDTLTGNILYEQKDISQSKTERNSHRASVELSQNVWDWGKSWNRLSQAKLQRQNAEYNLISRRNTVIYNVQEKYFELLKAIKLGKVYEEAVKRSEEQLNRIQSMYEIGSVALADVYKAKVALGNDQINLINQNNTIIIARANLNQAMGIDPSSPTEVQEIESSQLVMPFTLESALALSFEKNPELKSYELNVKNYQYARRNAQLAYLPTLNAYLSYSRDNEYFDRVYNRKLDENYVASLGLQMNLNIFKGFADQAELSRQTINRAKAEEDLIEKRRLLTVEVTQAFNVLRANREIIAINQTNLEAANEDLRLAQERYKIGAGTLLEVIDAQLAVTQAKSTLVSAEYNFQIALSYLKLLVNALQE